MSKFKKGYLFIVIASLIGVLTYQSYGAAAAPVPMSTEGYFRKLNRRLKGAMPLEAEVQNLKLAQKKNSEKEFLDKKVDEFLLAPQYADMMTLRLQELFRLNIYEKPYSEIKDIPEKYDVDGTSSVAINPYLTTMGGIFRDIVTQNLSWDELVLRKQFTVYSRGYGNLMMSGFGFFASVAPDKIPASYEGSFIGTLKEQQTLKSARRQQKTLNFDSSDPRIAGALTTEDFMQLYVNSTINKNRQRAAAIFKIFMCEDLVPSIPKGQSKKHAAMKLAFPHYEVTAEDVKNNKDTMKELLHGDKPDCFGCHKKLDPAGKHYQNSRVSLSPLASPGALVYDDENGKTVIVPTEGIGDFAKVLVRQPRYVDCQVKNIFSWIVGKDINLDEFPELKSRVIAGFESNGRKINDFVKFLVNIPEFRQKPEPSALSGKVTFSQVVPLLSRCNSCHNAGLIPLFNQLPFENKKGDHGYWINKIKERMNLPNGHSLKMPLDYPTWNQDDLAKLKSWISDGGH